MLTKNIESYNHLLIQIKNKEQITAEKLAEIANVSLATLNSWLASPNTKKWRRLNRDRFYFIKSRLYFSSQGSSERKDSICHFLYSIEQTLKIAKNSVLTGKPIANEELVFINEAIEMNQLIISSIHELIPPDEEEISFIKNLMGSKQSEPIDEEEEHYLEFLSSINKSEVLNLYNIEKQTAFIISNTLKVPSKFVQRFIKEYQEKNLMTLAITDN